MDKKIIIEALKKEIEILAEKAYRRGYQHGNLYAEHGVTQEHCADYRFEKPIYEPWMCPEKYADGEIHMRLMMGVSMARIHFSDRIENLIDQI